MDLKDKKIELIPEYIRSFEEISKQLRLNADILLKELSDYANELKSNLSNPSINRSNEWIKCSDGLPEYDTKILFTDGFDIFMGYLIINNENIDRWYLQNDQPIDGITHWMPLPSIDSIKE